MKRCSTGSPRTPTRLSGARPKRGSDSTRPIASDPHAPTGTLAGLAADPDVPTRLAVAGNPGSPAGVLAAMATTETDPEVLRLVAGHPALPVEAMRELISGKLPAAQIAP